MVLSVIVHVRNVAKLRHILFVCVNTYAPDFLFCCGVRRLGNVGIIKVGVVF